RRSGRSTTSFSVITRISLSTVRDRCTIKLKVDGMEKVTVEVTILRMKAEGAGKVGRRLLGIYIRLTGRPPPGIPCLKSGTQCPLPKSGGPLSFQRPMLLRGPGVRPWKGRRPG